VKTALFSEDLEAHGHFVLQPDGRALGPKLGPAMRDVMKAARAGEWQRGEDGHAVVGGQDLAPGEFELKLKPKEGEASQALRTNDAVVVLDVEVTPELKAEGTARDLIRKVQHARKEADYNIRDRIALALEASEDVLAAVRAHEAYIAEQVLADEIRYGAPADDMFVVDTTLAEGPLRLGVCVRGA
jgi:isoleucyl-tRNA synthetase